MTEILGELGVEKDSAAASSFRDVLNTRLKRGSKSWMNARTTLHHFALINYAIPKDRLSPHIPADRFEIPEFETEKGRFAFLSVVPFLDVDFCFPGFAPGINFTFFQTNHRAYVMDKENGQHCVWFFGTNLGSRIVEIPRTLWKIPWHYTTYSVEVRFNEGKNIYEKFNYRFRSEWCDGEIEIEDTGIPISECKGFSCLDEMKLILTHPTTGYFYRLDKKLGTYKIWHPEMNMTYARPHHLYFSLYKDLNIMSSEEMESPHSIFVCPKVDFEIYLPPRAVK